MLTHADVPGAKTYGLGTSSYASLYYVTTGFHMAHVIVGIVVMMVVPLPTIVLSGHVPASKLAAEHLVLSAHLDGYGHGEPVGLEDYDLVAQRQQIACHRE